MLSRIERIFVADPSSVDQVTRRVLRHRINKKIAAAAADLAEIIKKADSLGVDLTPLSGIAIERKPLRNSLTQVPESFRWIESWGS